MKNQPKFELLDSFLQLKKYCENENYKGWDPYDGLNSEIFQSTPLKRWSLGQTGLDSGV